MYLLYMNLPAALPIYATVFVPVLRGYDYYNI